MTTIDGEFITATADDGFLSVDNNNVTVVARNAELVSQG